MKTFRFSQKGKRLQQEDSYFVDDVSQKTFIICDGVGGSSGGQVASSTTIEFLAKYVPALNHAIIDDAIIISLFKVTTNNLLEVLNGHPENEGMATTIVLAWFTSKEVIISHLGDSRAYVVKPSSNSYWHTKDHSLVQELYDAGIIKSEADMQSHPMKNRITRAITSSVRSDVTAPSITRFDNLDPGDMIMLCSDGVLEAFQNEEFISILMDETLPFVEKGKKIQEECELKSTDNNTCIILQIEDGEGYASGSNAGVEFRKMGY